MKELALHILDIAENGIRAGADNIRIFVDFEKATGMMRIGISDNGMGMDKATLKRVSDPFFTSRTSRRIGMGVPLLRQQAEMALGSMEIQSKPGEGTLVEASFMADHPDRQPLGDLEGCWILLASANPGIEWGLYLRSDVAFFEITSAEIRSSLEIEEISGRELIKDLKRMIRNNIDELGLS